MCSCVLGHVDQIFPQVNGTALSWGSCSGARSQAFDILTGSRSGTSARDKGREPLSLRPALMVLEQGFLWAGSWGPREAQEMLRGSGKARPEGPGDSGGERLRKASYGCVLRCTGVWSTTNASPEPTSGGWALPSVEPDLHAQPHGNLRNVPSA